MSSPKTNPKNDRVKREYLVWLKEARQRSPATAEQARHAIDRLEAYTSFQDFGTFNKNQAIGFKQSLLVTSGSRSGKPISISTVYHTLHAVRDFFGWLSGLPGYRRRIRAGDIAFLNLTAGEEKQAHASGPKRYASLEDYRRALRAMPTDTEIERRDQALLALMLLTCMRDAAVVTLKLRHLHLERNFVFQDARDVSTKFRKTIGTTFYPVGEDVEMIVRNWVLFLVQEKAFEPGDPVFPKATMVQSEDGSFTARLGRAHWASATAVRKIFRAALERVGLQYVNPHSIRDTLTQFAYSLDLTPEELKAWSQNMGHDKPLTTLNSYGQLTPERQAEIIKGLTQKAARKSPDDTFLDRLADKVAARIREIATPRERACT